MPNLRTNQKTIWNSRDEIDQSEPASHLSPLPSQRRVTHPLNLLNLLNRSAPNIDQSQAVSRFTPGSAIDQSEDDLGHPGRLDQSEPGGKQFYSRIRA